MSSSAVREAVNILARASAQGRAAFDIAIQAMAEGLGCRWAGIATVDEDGKVLEILAASDGAAPLSTSRFPFRDSAAMSIYDAAGIDRCCVLHGDIFRRFPRDSMIAGRKIRYFAAALFTDGAGRPAGHVFVMDDRPHEAGTDADARELLDIVARRVGGDVAAWNTARTGSSVAAGLRSPEGAMSVISWRMEPGLRRITQISKQSEALFGYGAESWCDDGAWLERIYPKDRDHVTAALSMALKHGTGSEFEFRIRAEDGRDIWILGIVAQCERSEDDRPTLGGLWIDMSRQKLIQRELSETVKRFRDFAEADTDWFWEMDENLRFSFLSERFQDATGVDPAELIGRDRRQLLAINDSVVDDMTTDEDWEAHIKTLEAHKPFQDFRYTCPSECGQSFYLSISGKPIFDSDGSFVGYRGTGSNITDQVRTEKALRESERQLRLQSDRVEEASRAKSEFLANMSHEIRTPLNAILGFSDSMQREILGAMGNEKYREYASAIHVSGCHLLELVNDVLDLSKIEAGRYVLNRRTVDLVEIVEGCLQITRETASRKSITVVLDAPPQFPPINADLRAIKQVMLNLLTNALKYTDAGGRVSVSLQVTRGDVFFQVADTGVGIPQEDIASLTEAFVQGRNHNAYLAHEGTGLGLAISESLVQMHGGNLVIESEIGVGTVVKVNMPNAVETQQAAG